MTLIYAILGLALIACVVIAAMSRRSNNRGRPVQGKAITSWESDGFLSDEATNVETDFNVRYSSKVNLALSTNRMAHRLIYAIPVRTAELTDLLLSTLLTRQAANFQAFIVLSRKGMLDQADMLLRSLAETMFIVGAIGKDANFAKRFVLADEITRKKSLVRLNNDRARRGEAPDAESEALIASLIERIKDQEIKPFTTEQIAGIAGLESYYDTVYGFFSMAVHSASRSLDRALKADGDGNVTSIEYGPELDGFEMRLDYAISMALYVLHEVSTHFKQDPADVEALQRANGQLARSA